MAEAACEVLGRSKRPSVQLVAMQHNRSACLEFLGERGLALVAQHPLPNAQCPMPNAQRPTPNAQRLMQAQCRPSAQCPMAQCSLEPAQCSLVQWGPMQVATEEGLRLAASMRLGEGDALVGRLREAQQKLTQQAPTEGLVTGHSKPAVKGSRAAPRDALRPTAVDLGATNAAVAQLLRRLAGTELTLALALALAQP